MNLIEELISKSGLDEPQIKQKIEQKKAKFKNILNDETAAFLVAKELGINIDDSEITITPLNVLDESSKNVNVLVTIKSIFPKNVYSNNGKEGFFYNASIYDLTKQMPLTIWNQENSFKAGDIVLIKNAYISKFKDTLKLNTSNLSEIILKGQKEIAPSANKTVGELDFNDNGVNVSGVIYNKQEIKNFDYNGKQKSVYKFSLYDEGQSILVVAWDKIGIDLASIDANTKIVLKNAYVKNNMNRKELHMGERGSFEVLEKDVPLDIEPKLKKVSELAYDEKVKIEVSIKEFVRHFSADVCKVCATRMELKDSRFFCPKCNDYTQADKKVVIVYKVEDDSGTTNAVFFTKQAYSLLGADDSNVDDKLHNFNDYGKKVVLLGSLKKTQYDDEFIVSRVN